MPKGQKDRTEKLAWLAEYKLAHGCRDCGARSLPSVCYDFDHLPQYEKIDSLSQLAKSGSWLRLYAEVAKCEVVCANCHRIRTHGRRD